MANTRFQLKRSSVSGVSPTTSDIAAGELGINLADKKLFTSNGSSVFELGSNLTSLAVGNSTARQIVNSTGVYVNGSIEIGNDKRLSFLPTAGGSNVYFVQQSDDNFVFYNTTNTGAVKPVFNVYANTNSPNQNSAVKFDVPIDPVTGIYANNSLGSSGQVLTSNGTSVYWSTVSGGSGSINTAAQFTWTNTHTFQANVSFTGNGIGIASNTGAIYLGGIADANWRIGRSTGAFTKWSYTNNTIDAVIASSTDEGFAIGIVSGNSVFETGYKGTFIAANATVGNSTVYTTINATAFSGSANSATYANSSATNTFTVGTASYFVANGNLGIGTNSPTYLLDVAGTIRGQAAAGSGDVLIIGNDTKLVDIDTLHTAGLYSIGNAQIAGLKLASNGVTLTGYNGNLGVANVLPDATLAVTGTANISGNVVVGGITTFNGNVVLGSSGLSANGSFGSAGQVLHSNGSATYWATDDTNSGTVTSVDSGSGLTGGPITTSGTLSVLANNGITANSTGVFVTQGTGTVVNTTGVHVNSSYIGTLTANNATYFDGNSLATIQGQITGNAATAYANAVANAAALYQTTAGLSANVATLAANSATYLGNSSGTIANLASWITGNAATAYTNAVVFASNASNINTGTLAEARLPFRMNQDVQTIDNVTFATLTVTGNLTVNGSYVVVSGNSVVFTDNMIYLNNGISATITNITSNGTHVVFTANNNYQVGWDVTVTGVNPSSYNGNYLNITAANTTSFTVANTNTDSYVSGGTARGKTEANPDLGIAAGYNDGTYQHAGFFRDHSSGVWKVFDGYLPEPDTSIYIDQTNASFNIAKFQASEIRVGNNTVYGTVNTTNFDGTSNAATYLGNSSGTVANIASWITGNAATAYTNATTFAANASNINTGTLAWAQAPSGTVNTSGAFTITGTYTYQVDLIVGNTTVNTQLSNASILLSNSTSTTTLGLDSLKIGNTTTNVVIANTVSTFGGNVVVSGVTTLNGNLVLGNSGLSVNGSFGTAGQVLHSNGSSAYWSNIQTVSVVAEQFTANGTANSFTVTGGYTPGALEVYVSGVKQIPGTDVVVSSGNTVNFAIPPLDGQIVDVFGYLSLGPISGTVTSVGSGNGLTGGPITSSGTLSVLANSGIIANSTGVFVNSAYIATLDANSATYANSSATNTFTVGTATYFVANGNVGIGTSSPSSKLEVDGSVRLRATGGEGGQLELFNPDNSLIGAILDVSSANNTRWFTTVNNSSHQIGQLSGTGGVIALYTEASERMRIDASGNVGIGNTAPDAKLAITGTANISGNVAIGGTLKVNNSEVATTGKAIAMAIVFGG